MIMIHLANHREVRPFKSDTFVRDINSTEDVREQIQILQSQWTLWLKCAIKTSFH